MHPSGHAPVAVHGDLLFSEAKFRKRLATLGELPTPYLYIMRGFDMRVMDTRTLSDLVYPLDFESLLVYVPPLPDARGFADLSAILDELRTRVFDAAVDTASEIRDLPTDLLVVHASPEYGAVHGNCLHDSVLHGLGASIVDGPFAMPGDLLRAAFAAYMHASLNASQ